MSVVRRWLYRCGFRPRPGSIFHSPSLAWCYLMRDNDFGGNLAAAIDAARAEASGNLLANERADDRSKNGDHSAEHVGDERSIRRPTFRQQ